jgi:hypothetical protein
MLRLILTLALACATAAYAQQPAQKAAPRKPATPQPAPSADLPPPPADPDQVTAASLVHMGDYDCEFKQLMRVNLSQKYANYVDVEFGNLRYTVKPVLSTTGALRLEDLKGRYLVLQIAYKSMMLDVKSGRRVVDECVHEKHIAARRAAEAAAAQEAADAAAAKAAPVTAPPPAPTPPPNPYP